MTTGPSDFLPAIPSDLGPVSLFLGASRFRIHRAVATYSIRFLRLAYRMHTYIFYKRLSRILYSFLVQIAHRVGFFIECCDGGCRQVDKEKSDPVAETTVVHDIKNGQTTAKGFCEN